VICRVVLQSRGDTTTLVALSIRSVICCAEAVPEKIRANAMEKPWRTDR
jgi:hypothetical protein